MDTFESSVPLIPIQNLSIRTVEQKKLQLTKNSLTADELAVIEME
jgi:hypothetical protein